MAENKQPNASGKKPDENSNVKFTKKQKEVIKDTIAETVDKELNSASKATQPKKDNKKPNNEPPKVIIKKQVSSKKSRNLAIIFSCLGGAALIGGAGALIYVLTHKSSEEKIYTVSFLDGNGNPISNQKIKSGITFAEVTFPDPDLVTAPTGKYFSGKWFLDKDLSKQVKSTDKVEANLSIYPSFNIETAEKTRTIRYSAGDGTFYPGTGSEEVKTTYRSSFETVLSPYPYKKTNDITELFIGWVDDYDKPILHNTVVKTDINAHAKYGPASTSCFIRFALPEGFTIKHGCLGSGCVEGTKFSEIVKPLTADEFAEGGYALKHWQNDSTKEELTEDSVISEDMTISPVIEPLVNYHTITFSANGGSWEGETTQIKYALDGTKFGEIMPAVNPTKTDGLFWYWADKNNNRILSDTSITSDFTANAIYATLTDKVYTAIEIGGTTQYGWIDEASLTSQTDNIKIHFQQTSGESEYSISRYEFNYPIYVGSQRTEIGDNFLYDCYKFNSEIIIYGNLTKIGDNFLYECYDFNQPLIMPKSLVKIGDKFLYSCEKFNQEFTLNDQTDLEIGAEFMCNCKSYEQMFVFDKNIKSVGQGTMFNCDKIKMVEIECPLSKFTDDTDKYAFATSRAEYKDKSIYVYTQDESIKSGISNKWKTLQGSSPSNIWRELISNVYGDSLGIFYDDETGKINYIDATAGWSGSHLTTDDKYLVFYHEGDPVNYTKSTFNKRLYFNPDKVTEIPNNFMKGMTCYDQPFNILENVTKIGDNFMLDCNNFSQEIKFSNKLTSIGSHFMQGVNCFNHPLTIPDTVTEIKDYFLSGCAQFNSELTLPTTLTKIGTHFLYNMRSFMQPIVIPNTVTSVGDAFMCAAINATSVTVNCSGSAFSADKFTLATNDKTGKAYTEGVLVKGIGADVLIDNLKDPGQGFYRNIKEDKKSTLSFEVQGSGGTIDGGKTSLTKKHVPDTKTFGEVKPSSTPAAGYKEGIWHDSKGNVPNDSDLVKPGEKYYITFEQIFYKPLLQLSFVKKVSGPDTYTYGQTLTYKFEKTDSGSAYHFKVYNAGGGALTEGSQFTCDQNGNLTIPGQFVDGIMTIMVSYY